MRNKKYLQISSERALMNLEPLTRNRYYMAGRKQPMTRDEAFEKLVLQFPSCEIKSISDDHKYVTYCKVTRACKLCGYEWATKVSNALHLGSGCGRCAKRAAARAQQAAHLAQDIPAQVYRLDSECGRYCKIGFTQNFKKRVSSLKSQTPFSVGVPEVIFSGSAEVAFALEERLVSSCVSAGFSGFCGATEWLLSEDLDKKLLDM